MSDVIGRGVIELVGDARKLNASINDAKKSIRTLGEGQKDISKSASQSIDKYIGRLQQQNATLGMSTRETELYKLALRGASNEQLNAANATLKLAENHRATAGIVSALNTGLIAAAAAGMAAVGGLAALVISSINAADHLHDLNKTTGISVENLSGLALAAKQSGGDLDGIAASISKLSVNMGKDAEKFAALGITAKDPLEAFKQLADIFVAIDNPQMRAALGAAALGKSWMSAAPLLAEGGKSIGEMVEKGKRLSGVTTEMADQADKFNDSLVELKTTSAGLGVKMAGDMLPAFNSITKAVQLAFEESGKLATLWTAMGSLGAFLFTDEFASAKVKLKTLGEELKTLELNQAGLAKNAPSGGIISKWIWGDKGEIEAKITNTKAQIAGLVKSMEPPKTSGLKPATNPLLAAKVEAFIGEPRAGASGASNAGVNKLKLYTSALQQLELQLGKTIGMSATEKTAYELTYGSLKTLNREHGAALLAIAAEIDARRNMLEVLKMNGAAYDALFQSKQKLDALSTAGFEADQQHLDDLKFETRMIGASEDVKKRMTELRTVDKNLQSQLKSAADIAGDNWTQFETAFDSLTAQAENQKVKISEVVDAYNAANEEINSTAIEKTKETTDEITEFWKKAAQSIQSSMSDFFFDAMQGKTSDLFGSLKASLDRLVANVLAAKAATMLFGADFGKGGNVGGLLGNLFDSGTQKPAPVDERSFVTSAVGGVIGQAAANFGKGGRIGVVGDLDSSKGIFPPGTVAGADSEAGFAKAMYEMNKFRDTIASTTVSVASNDSKLVSLIATTASTDAGLATLTTSTATSDAALSALGLTAPTVNTGLATLSASAMSAAAALDVIAARSGMNTGGMSGLFGGASDMAFGNTTFADAFAGGMIPMAKGGDFLVTKPTLFMAGEAGPERATFSGANNTGGSGGMSVTNIFHISGQTDRRSQAQIASAAGEGVQRAMTRNT